MLLKPGKAPAAVSQMAPCKASLYISLSYLKLLFLVVTMPLVKQIGLFDPMTIAQMKPERRE